MHAPTHGACATLGGSPRRGLTDKVLNVDRIIGRFPIDVAGARQNALPLIAITSCAPAHHDSRQSVGLGGASGECGVTGRQKLEVAEVDAVQTQCPSLVLEEEVAGVAARRARPRVVRRDHNDPLGTARWALDYKLRSVG
jgi:hypothetical protein